MTRYELMARIDGPELDDWWLLEVTDPWGQLREDIRFAKLARDISILLGSKKEGGKAFTVDDFMLTFEIDRAPKPAQTVAQMESLLKLWVKSANVRFARQARRQLREAGNAT